MSMIEEILEHLTEKNIRDLSAQVRKKQMDEIFWVILQEGAAANPIQYAKKEDAVNAASMMASRYNEKFYVLESVGVATPQEIPVHYFDLP